MTKSDRELGMNRSITRRDFLNGVSVAIGEYDGGAGSGGRGIVVPAQPRTRSII